MRKYLKLLFLVVALSVGFLLMAGCGNDVGGLRTEFVNEFVNAENSMAEAVPMYRQGVVDMQAGKLDSAETKIVKAESLAEQAYNNRTASIANDMQMHNAGASEMKLASLMNDRIEHFTEAVNHSLNAIEQHSDVERYNEQMRLAQQEYWQSYASLYQRLRNFVMLDKNLVYVHERLGW